MEVRLAEGARGVRGVVEFDPLVEAVDLGTLDTGSRSQVSFWLEGVCHLEEHTV